MNHSKLTCLIAINKPGLLLATILAFFAISFNSCSKKNDPAAGPATTSIDSSTVTSGTPEGSILTGYDADDLIENSTFTSTVTISFGTTVTISNPLATAGVIITQTGSDIIITSTATAVEYVISGTTTDGSIKVYSDKKFKLTLNGATITNSDGPALNIQSSKRAFIVLADSTVNTLTDGSTYATSTEDQKGTIFSEGQLIFSGNGALNVKGNYKHGIVSDDYIRVRSGVITVSGSVKDGIHTNNAFIADGGTIKITSGSDGIEAEKGYIIINNGLLTLNTTDEGIVASYEDTDTTIKPYVNINGGTITINSSGGKGIESKSVLTINKGTVFTTTVDDGLAGGTAVYINGGAVYSSSTGNDAMDSNGTFTVTGGKVIAVSSKSTESGIDCGIRVLKITGGTVIGIGSATSAPSATASTVNSVILGSGTSNQVIHIEAADGTEALTYMIPTSYTTLLFASSKLKASTTYNVYNGGSVTSGTSFSGLYTSGTYTKGASSSTFTTSGIVTQVGGTINKN